MRDATDAVLQLRDMSPWRKQCYATALPKKQIVKWWDGVSPFTGRADSHFPGIFKTLRCIRRRTYFYKLVTLLRCETC